MEAEANRYAAMLLMPPPILRTELQRIRRSQVSGIVRLARLFEVSKDAMARAFVDYSCEAVAVVVVQNGRVLRHYRNERTFPWIDVHPRSAVPMRSIYHGSGQLPGEVADEDECEPEVWLGPSGGQKIEALTEQVLAQRDGRALILLRTGLRDDYDR